MNEKMINLTEIVVKKHSSLADDMIGWVRWRHSSEGHDSQWERELSREE